MLGVFGYSMIRRTETLTWLELLGLSGINKKAYVAEEYSWADMPLLRAKNSTNDLSWCKNVNYETKSLNWGNRYNPSAYPGDLTYFI